MDRQEEFKRICEIIDANARTLVGHVLKRVEILQKQNVLTPELYKSLTKEHIYEDARALKDKLSLFYNIPGVKFVPKTQNTIDESKEE